MQKPSLPSGTRDFGPAVFKKRRYIMQVMETIFLQHGFMGIETPALENLATLQGKYGDEGDQLLFKVLNSGAYLEKVSAVDLENTDYHQITPKIAQRGLRYDLTVPLARFVVMNRNDIQFPFKRFQMQPVWRADRPQKGRYREFWQCDVDIVGTKHLLSEAELVEMYSEVFQALDLGVEIRINHRFILDAFLPLAGSLEAWNSFMQAIDKYDKIGVEGVADELRQRHLDHMVAAWLSWCQIADMVDFEEQLSAMLQVPEIQNDSLLNGVSAMKELWTLLSDFPQKKLDVRLARGLSYYTGCVFEVVPNDARLPKDFRIGSIGGGGRYDNLTGIFGLKDVSGVGVSFGLDRIYDTLEALGGSQQNLKPEGILLCPMMPEAEVLAFQLARLLREGGHQVEVYPGSVKLKKQLDYANARNREFALIIGETEIESQQIAVKNLENGTQQLVSINELSSYFSNVR